MHKSIKNAKGVIYTHSDNDILGNGTSATVYLAVNKQTKQKVAVKTIYKPKQEDANLMRTEIRVYVTLKGTPNIVNILDFFQTDQHLYMILEWCNGGDLRNLLSTSYKLQEETAIKYLQGIVEGLYALHSKGIMYRDLKPENILFKEGEIKIGDFGTASFEERSNNHMGTKEYMAPEMYFLNEESDYDKQVDIWSLGIIFYEMLFGCTPCDGDKQKRENILKNGCIIPQDSISSKARDLLQKMLKLNPVERIKIEEIHEHPIFSLNENKDYDMIENEEEKTNSDIEPSQSNPVQVKLDSPKTEESQEGTINIKEEESVNQVKESFEQDENKSNIGSEDNKDKEEMGTSKGKDENGEVSQAQLEEKLAQIESGEGEIKEEFELQFEIIEDEKEEK